MKGEKNMNIEDKVKKGDTERYKLAVCPQSPYRNEKDQELWDQHNYGKPNGYTGLYCPTHQPIYERYKKIEEQKEQQQKLNGLDGL